MANTDVDPSNRRWTQTILIIMIVIENVPAKIWKDNVKLNYPGNYVNRRWKHEMKTWDASVQKYRFALRDKF